MKQFRSIAALASATALVTALAACDADDVAEDLGINLDSTVTIEPQGVTIDLPTPIVVVNETAEGLGSGDSVWTAILTAREIQISVSATETATRIDSSLTMQAQYLAAKTAARNLFDVQDSSEVKGKDYQGMIYQGQGFAGQAATENLSGFLLVALKGYRTYTIQAYPLSGSAISDSAAVRGIVESIEIQ